MEGKILEYYDEKCELKIKQSELDKITKLEIINYIDPNDEVFMGLQYFRNLEYLDIQGSTAFNINELETLENLKYLNISNCAIDNKVYDLSFLKRLKQLEYLNTQGTVIKNEEYIQNLENLKEWKN